MAIERDLVGALLLSALLVGAAPGVAAPGEPLVVTPMPDPDPDFVPTRDDKQRDRETIGSRDANARIEQAMEAFGHAIGQAAMIDQQQIEARCRQGEPESATPEQRFAWAASCRYSRH
ncbi:MAG TPA: hypothetical protein VGU01_02220 [Sphingomicrobium sp.]|nr:hypothetical protein [Sphingomicrobium sp.]